MNITIIAAALPPQIDGIGDYTACLAAELTHSASVTILTGAPTPDPIPGVRIETVFSATDPPSVQGIADFVKTNPPDWVLLQYNPFSFGKWGRNLHLPRIMAQIKRECPQTRFALMVHEPFVPFESWRFAIMATWQRWQLWQLGHTANVIFFSIDPWAIRFQRWFPDKPIVHLPVGSNMPHIPISRQDARARLEIGQNTVVLGFFGTGHVSRLLQPIREAAEAVRQAGYDVQVLYIGPQGQIMREAMGDLPIIADGPLSTEEVSRRLAAIDIYLAAYTDGISTRRGAFLSALQHGLAVVATLGHNTDAVLKSGAGTSFLAADVNAPKRFQELAVMLAKTPALRQSLEKQAERFYQHEFAWRNVAERLLTAIEQASGFRKATGKFN